MCFWALLVRRAPPLGTMAGLRLCVGVFVTRSGRRVASSRTHVARALLVVTVSSGGRMTARTVLLAGDST
jgi:hypothetical protein